jgi:ABC-type multidrug transport system ATPase subunit
MFNKSKDSAIRLLNFSQSDGNKELLSPTTLSFPKGRIGVFVGKQDVNKAHFMRAIAGFEEAQSGDVVIGNRSLRNSGADYKRNVFLVSSSIQFNLPCTLAHIPGILMGFYEDWDFVAYRTWLDHMQLEDSIPYSQLSTSAKMRALVAIAMACGAEVLLFDDIDSYLDSEQQKTLVTALQMKCSAGVTVLMGSRRLSRWVKSDIDLYSFKDSSLIRVDAALLRKRIVGEESDRPTLSSSKGWTRKENGDENTATMTMTFVAT